MRLTNNIPIPKTYRRMFRETFIFLAGGFFFLTSCFVLMLLNNIIWTPPGPLEYEVVEFLPCSGWSKSGLAKKESIFRPTGDHIFACGLIDINQSPILLLVYWEYEGRVIYRDVIRNVEDQFISELPSTGKDFPVGNYEVRLVIRRKTAERAEFKVASP